MLRSRVVRLSLVGWSILSTSAALGQVRMELRIVPQAGSPGDVGGVVDLAEAPPMSLAGQVQRFELQYRIVDVLTFDAIVPTGLYGATINVTLTGATGGAALDRAQLSQFECALAAGVPPATTDTSGLAAAPLDTAQGMHRPFRFGIPNPAPNNTHANNGIISPDGLSITHIVPIAGASVGQNAPGGPDTLGAFYGLYSFNVVAGPQPPTDPIIITASFEADPNTGNRFGYFRTGTGIPSSSPDANPAAILLPVPNGGCCRPDNTCILTVQGACDAAGGQFRGVGSGCARSGLCLQSDFNNSSLITVQDLFDFLAAYFAGDQRTDFNHSGTSSVQDLFDYLAAYFSGV